MSWEVRYYRPTMTHVTDYGAAGDGLADDSDAIERAVGAAWQKGGVLVFPRGIYRTTRTVSLGEGIGLRVQGAGHLPHSFEASHGDLKLSKQWAASILYYDGPERDPVVRFGGSNATIDGLTIWGRGKASVGFQLYKASGIGSGHVRFPGLAINGCNVGFACGDQKNDGNCADLDFQTFNVSNCGTGFMVVNDQGVNYTFSHADFSDVRTAFHFGRGGMCNVSFMHGVRISKNVLVIKHVGSGNGLYRIGMLSLDADQGENGPPRLVNQRTWGPARVVIESAKMGGSRKSSYVRAFGEADVTIRNAAYLNGPLAHLETGVGGNGERRARVRFENCKISGEVDPGTANRPSGVVELDRCTDYRGNEVHL